MSAPAEGAPTRVLWVAPWGRPLATVFAQGLRAAGAEVLVVTTPLHYEAVAEQDQLLLVTGSPRNPASWATAVSALRAARRFRPHVVVTEELTDPRLLPLLALAPVAVLVHDDAPHDPTEVQPWHRRAVAERVRTRADLVLTFSEHVGAIVRRRHRAVVRTVPLPSEAPQELVPPLVPAEGRRDVVVLGRINPYKDLPTTLRAWELHLQGPAYRGDELLIIGDGSEDELRLPPHCRWRRERFQFDEVLPVLARAKASVVHYRSATQSGVQITSMQCGTAAIVSDAGGLAEHLPPGELPVPAGDPVLLAAALDALADPVAAAVAGAAARKHHDSTLDREHAGRQLLAALAEVLR